MAKQLQSQDIPFQPVPNPIICSPYEEPTAHWFYNPKTGIPEELPQRRPASYWYKTEAETTGQLSLLAEENRENLPLINLLREDVKKWRESGYRGASSVTRDLLQHWGNEERFRRLFFCQREAVETIIYLAEMRFSNRSSRTGFQKFAVSDENIQKLIKGEKPDFDFSENTNFFPTLIDEPADSHMLPLRRMGCKMATGSGKTVVMAMLIAWAFCNRGQNPQSTYFPNAVLVCCPNLTVKERLQVLRPELPDNYYNAFDIVPIKYRPLMQKGKVLVTNWHAFAPESEHKEGDKTYAVVNKGPETPQTFTKRILGDLADRMPIMVLNDEGHHCWRPAPDEHLDDLSKDEMDELETEAEEARVWLSGLDQLNNAMEDRQPGVSLCVDLSATPFYLKGSGHPEGRPFPWLVSDFGLVDAIESGIVKIPRLPVTDTTGRPDPKYFKLWDSIKAGLQPAEFLPGRAKKPKPDVIYREAEAALQQIAGQWVERFNYIQEATPGQEKVPPVLIIVCDNTDIAEIFYQNISGEREEVITTQAEVEEVLSDGEDSNEEEAPKGKKKKSKTRTVYGEGRIFPQYFSNTQDMKRTIRIDSKLLAEAESLDANGKSKKKKEAAEALRQIVATVGRPGQPGEHVRCVVSVSMLTEGWDANNVTHILGLRAFGSQLLCEQVVGRGLRRMDYTATPDPDTGKLMLSPEYVDVYGIPFSVIPFKGRPTSASQPEDKPKNHVRALPERTGMEMRFPVVEGYVFSLKKNLIRCDLSKVEKLVIQPNLEPTATFLEPSVGYRVGSAAQHSNHFGFAEQNRAAYYAEVHMQTILFNIARQIVEQLSSGNAVANGSDTKKRVMALQSRHQLFPQVLKIVQDYVASHVDFQGCPEAELGLEIYVTKIVERLRDAIIPDDEEGEPPLLPILNRYKPMGTTEEVNFKTTRPCYPTQHSHINQVVSDTKTWETSTAFKLEQSVMQGSVKFYARNDSMGLVIPYEFLRVDHSYEPDFLVRLNIPDQDVTVLLEIKGFESEETRAKHQSAKRWVEAVNNWGKLGHWEFHVCKNPQVLDQELRALAAKYRTQVAAVTGQPV